MRGINDCHFHEAARRMAKESATDQVLIFHHRIDKFRLLADPVRVDITARVESDVNPAVFDIVPKLARAHFGHTVLPPGLGVGRVDGIALAAEDERILREHLGQEDVFGGLHIVKRVGLACARVDLFQQGGKSLLDDIRRMPDIII